MVSGSRSAGVAFPPALGRSISNEPDLSFIIIGSGGWISAALIDLLQGALTPDAFQRRVMVLGSSARVIDLPRGGCIRSVPLTEWAKLEPRRCLVFYNAFLTRDKVAGLSLGSYLQANRRISDMVSSLVSAWPIQGLMLPSSGAVYASDGSLETDFEANPYGALKAVDEYRFLELAAEREFSCAIARIFGLSGEFINKPDIYALSSIILQASRSPEIVLRATGQVYRSYIYVGDLLSLCLTMLLGDARRTEVFDTGGEVVEVGELAERVRLSLGRDTPIRRTVDPDAPPDRYVGDPRRLFLLLKALGLDILSLDAQISRTAVYLLH